MHACRSTLEDPTLGAAGKERFAARSDALGQQLESGLVHGDFAAAREAFVELEALLKTLGPIETEGIARIVGIAATYGCAAKISGAGGGDGCVIVCPDVEKRTALLEGLSARDFFALPLELTPGMKGEAQGQPDLARWIDAAG